MIRVRSPTRFSRSRLGRLASSSSSVGIATIPQCPRSPRSQPRNTRISIAGIQPVGLRPPVLAGHGDARRMDDVRLNAARAQPPRQPESVAARLIGESDAPDRPARLHRLRPPALDQAQQRFRIGLKLLQRLSDQRREAFLPPASSPALISTTTVRVVS